MDINLHIVNKQLQTPAWDVQLRLTARGITLGRHPANDVCLDDPERVISGQHARIDARDGGLWVTDTSRNGTYLNNANHPLPSQQAIAISAGDRLAIGGLEIVVTISGQSASVTDAGAGGSAAQDVAELMGRHTAPDILDLLGPCTGQTAADFMSSARAATHSDARFTDAAPLNAALSGPASTAPAREATPRPTAVEHVFYRPAQPMPDDYDLLNDAWSGSAPPAAAVIPAVPVPPVRYLQDTLPAELDFSTASIPLAPASSAHSELAAFFAGLGVGQPSAVPQPEALFQQAGELLRVLVAGLSLTLMGRAQFKNELRLGMTTIRAAENNPFKFAVDTNSLLERLLLQPNPGFLPATAAAQAGFDDIQAHEMAMTAGLQAALRALFARFEPAELERRLSNSGVNPMLPIARKARCWEFFTETYEQVAAEASEDFMQLFETAFARAYQEQIRRLAETRSTQRLKRC